MSTQSPVINEAAESANRSRAQRLAMKWQHAVGAISETVVVDPRLRDGVPCLAGTRVTLSQVIAQLAEGETIDEIADDMSLDKDALVQFLNGLSSLLDLPAHEARATG